METLLHADIFFFVTTLAVVIVTILLGVALMYLIIFLRNARDISEAVRAEAGNIVEDVATFRESIKDKASTINNLIGAALTAKFIKKALTPKKQSKKKPKKDA